MVNRELPDRHKCEKFLTKTGEAILIVIEFSMNIT